MKIEKLEIKGFGRLRNFTLNLADGINIIYGGNETGKSTLLYFIKAMLYGLKGGRTTRDGILPELKRFSPWDQGEYGGAIEYRLDNGSRFRVERSFGLNSVHVYDSFFNDITDKFDVNKEKSPLFAEAHTGMNEICFEKTVLIKQMELKINEDGSKELLSRLANVSQTGFEDVSFKRAQEALKEALKESVGTDKTSTRPLDRVVERLEELDALKKNLIKRRNSQMNVEYGLSAAAVTCENLRRRKDAIAQVNEVYKLKRSIAEISEKRSELEGILNRINIEEDELEKVSTRIEEFSRTKEEFGRFSVYSNDDIDTAVLQYYEIKRHKDANSKLKWEMDRKREEIAVIEGMLAPLKAFAAIGDDVEAEALELSRVLERLKAEYEKNNIDILNERINNAQYRNKRAMFNIVISSVLTLVFVAAGRSMPVGFYAAMAGALLTILLIFLKRKSSKELSALLKQKRMSFVSFNGIVEETNKKQKILEGILRKASAGSLEEFLKLKAEYDNKTQRKASGGGYNRAGNRRGGRGTYRQSEIRRKKTQRVNAKHKLYATENIGPQQGSS
jgi:hypothetical protein